ncbi:MAG: 2OG-Fe(II) oxygenase [Wenzhouxiangella sp.]
MLASDAALASAAAALSAHGWWLGENALKPTLAEALAANLAALRQAEALHQAGIGRETDHQLRPDIRGDRIHWLTRSDPVQARFLAQMEALRLVLNRRLFLGLFEFEAHYAHYPAGAFYRRHLDSFQGAANRVVSLVAYLNPDWGAEDGGELVLYDPAGESRLATIIPKSGRIVLFLSEEIPHEVLPARRDRLSIAGWFRLNASIAGQIDPPR